MPRQRSNKRKGKSRSPVETEPRRAGASGTRLRVTAAPSAEISQRRRAQYQPQPVTVRWEAPSPRVKHPDAEATPNQRAYVAVLARKAGVEVPHTQTRREASEVIGTLRALAIRRGEQDPDRARRRRATAAAET